MVHDRGLRGVQAEARGTAGFVSAADLRETKLKHERNV